MWADSPDVTLFGAYRYTRGQWRLMHRHADFPPADQRPTTTDPR